MTEKLTLISESEQALRLSGVRASMRRRGVEAMIIRDFANLYYLTGRVFDGYVYIGVEDSDAPVFFVKRPVHLSGPNVHSVSKPEKIGEFISVMPANIGFELDTLSYSLVERLGKVFDEVEMVNASPVMREARAVKTDEEVRLIAADGVRHAEVYRRIPGLYTDGMTDIELQVEIERVSRLRGCLGQFRVSGDTMEIFMGNLLAGDNADAPSPYDFAMGGAGADPSLPVGANGTMIRPGMSVMVDMNGNFNGYMTDMTRTFSLGEIAPKALEAHQCSIDICRQLAAMGRPGTAAKDLYEKAVEIAESRGLAEYFMGHRQHAGFVGHGLGIQVNELPVLSPRSRDILQENNVIAIEPKFVIPGTGAVGIENTYVVRPDGLEALTKAPEQIIGFVE